MSALVKLRSRAKIDFDSVREDFPILKSTVDGLPLTYLDNAATAQKPKRVIQALEDYWLTQNANVHRGVHHLSQISTREFDGAREKVRMLLNAKLSKEVIFTKGCTESINLVASGLASSSPTKSTSGPRSTAWIQEGDEILISNMEHHSNIVPWQIVAERVGAVVRVIPITDQGEIDLEAYGDLLSSRTKVVAIVHVSNSLGTINPLKQMISMAHSVGARVLVDGAQAGPHITIDVQDLSADYYVLSCHKIYAPTGVGVLYGKEELLEELPPYQGGGDMIRTVSFERTTFAELPAKFEAGTPNIAGVIGLGAGIEYLVGLGATIEENSEPGAQRFSQERSVQDTWNVERARLEAAFAAIQEREAEVSQSAEQQLMEIEGLRLIGTAPHKTGIVSFTLEQAHPHDVGTILDSQGIAVRTGHHCCMPLMTRFGIPATTRASFAFYNTFEEANRLVEGVRKVTELFS